VDVLDGDAADTFLVSANSEDGGASLFLVGADDPGVTRTTPRCMDDTRPVSTVVFDGASSRLVGTECTSGEALRATRILLRLALAAESVGAAEYCMEMAAEYAKTRHQFGRPIGQFQSIKHKCADMFVDVQASLAAVHSAFTEIEESGSCSELSSAVASTFVADAFVRIASSNMQIHGGIALTWEHSAQLFLKRAKATQLLFGSPDTEIARIGAMIFDGGMSSPSEAYA
jgi:alkylation response protein AidB-like acyl-CoA dehydrogenase